MELLKDLELMEVKYENDQKKAVMTFLDAEHGEIRIVNFNRQSYDGENYIDDPEKAKKVDEWCNKFFNLAFMDLTKAVGEKHDVYVYDNFNSLFEVDIVSKFGPDMDGQIINTEIKEINVDKTAIHIRFDYEGDTYESKMSFAQYMESMKQWFTDPQKKDKQFKKFEEKFGCKVDDAQSLVGHQIIVEVKTAFKHQYAEIKPFPKKK